MHLVRVAHHLLDMNTYMFVSKLVNPLEFKNDSHWCFCKGECKRTDETKSRDPESRIQMGEPDPMSVEEGDRAGGQQIRLGVH